MTPSRTPAQSHAAAPLVGGRPSVAIKELKRRLETELPLQVAYENETLGLSGAAAYQAPKDYVLAPVPVSDRFICNLLIGHDVRSQVRGMAGAFVLTLDVSIWIPDKRIEAEEQLLDGSDRAIMVAMVLEQYHAGCTDPLGRRAWTTLEPQPTFLSVLPESWKEYSGFSLNYTLIQGTAATLWSAK